MIYHTFTFMNLKKFIANEHQTEKDIPHDNDNKNDLMTKKNKIKNNDFRVLSLISMPLINNKVSGNIVPNQSTLSIFFDKDSTPKLNNIDNIVGSQYMINLLMTSDPKVDNICFQKYIISHNYNENYNENISQLYSIKDGYDHLDTIMDNFKKNKIKFNCNINENDTQEISYQFEIPAFLNKFTEEIKENNNNYHPLSFDYNNIVNDGNLSYKRSTILLERLPFLCLHLFELIKIYSITKMPNNNIKPTNDLLLIDNPSAIANIIRTLFLIPVFINQVGGSYETQEEKKKNIQTIRDACIQVIWDNLDMTHSSQDKYNILFGLNADFYKKSENNSLDPHASIIWCKKMYHLFTKIHYNLTNMDKNPNKYENNNKKITIINKPINLNSIIMNTNNPDKLPIEFGYEDENESQDLSNLDPKLLLNSFLIDQIILSQEFNNQYKKILSPNMSLEEINQKAKELNNNEISNNPSSNGRTIAALSALSVGGIGAGFLGSTIKTSKDQDNSIDNNPIIVQNKTSITEDNNPIIVQNDTSITEDINITQEDNGDENPLLKTEQ